jgi:D-glycero-alpha-D-manno-heptose-7-phosphate kinase
MTGGHVNAGRFGEILDLTWRLKRGLASTITTDQIDCWYNRAQQAGAYGGKLCGAGGGGFLLFIVAPEKQDAVRAALAGLIEVPVRYEVHGSHVVQPFVA